MRIMQRMEVVDETPLDLIVLESIKAATTTASNVLNRHNTCATLQNKTHAEQVGIFVTALRSELARRAYDIPKHLQNAYEYARMFLVKVENWKEIGTLGEPAYVWKKTASGRMKRQRSWELHQYELEQNMDKARIQQLTDQAKKEQSDGKFDFDGSFSAMRDSIRDMNLNTQRVEAINGQATTVCEGLCKVAESLVIDL